MTHSLARPKSSYHHIRKRTYVLPFHHISPRTHAVLIITRITTLETKASITQDVNIHIKLTIL